MPEALSSPRLCAYDPSTPQHMSGRTRIRSMASAELGGLPVSTKNWATSKGTGCHSVICFYTLCVKVICHSFWLSSVWTPLSPGDPPYEPEPVSYYIQLKMPGSIFRLLLQLGCRRDHRNSSLMQVAAVTEGSGPNTDALYQVLVVVPASSLGHQWWLLGTSSAADAEICPGGVLRRLVLWPSWALWELVSILCYKNKLTIEQSRERKKWQDEPRPLHTHQADSTIIKLCSTSVFFSIFLFLSISLSK